MYKDILNRVTQAAKMSFEEASAMIERCVDEDTSFLDTLQQIGTIPEFIIHDSTEEKLFSKASDAVLSRAFRELGLKSSVLKGRGDSADVSAKSDIHGYTLVADAKAFRMSRTAKNQKTLKSLRFPGGGRMRNMRFYVPRTFTTRRKPARYMDKQLQIMYVY